jgi:hypothetical protein
MHLVCGSVHSEHLGIVGVECQLHLAFRNRSLGASRTSASLNARENRVSASCFQSIAQRTSRTASGIDSAQLCKMQSLLHRLQAAFSRSEQLARLHLVFREHRSLRTSRRTSHASAHAQLCRLQCLLHLELGSRSVGASRASASLTALENGVCCIAFRHSVGWSISVCILHSDSIVHSDRLGEHLMHRHVFNAGEWGRLHQIQAVSRSEHLACLLDSKIFRMECLLHRIQAFSRSEHLGLHLAFRQHHSLEHLAHRLRSTLDS